MAPVSSDITPESLLELTQNLVTIPSPSRSEKKIADHLENILKEIDYLQTERIGDNLIARTDLGKAQRLLIGGHIDTVEHAPDFAIERTPMSLSGPGAVDMKGGIAVMLALIQQLGAQQLSKTDLHNKSQLNLTFLFYACEEIDITESGLRQIEATNPDLLKADAAILMEPTGGVIEAGCQGTMKVQLKLHGKRAHTARAWKGENAIHRLAPVLTAINQWVPRQPMIQNCKFHEALQVVSVSGGVAGNVVPDVAEALINIRFAPDKKSDTALMELAELVKSALDDSDSARDSDNAHNSDNAPLQVLGKQDTLASQHSQTDPTNTSDSLSVLDVAEPAMPDLSHPILSKLLEQDLTVRAKLGWTDVSFFAEKNVSAINFGPGDPELAHTSSEKVSGRELMDVYKKLRTLITDI